MQGSIRKATIEDAGQITDIYNYYVAETTITFEEDPVTVLEMQERISKISKSYPYLVYECDGQIIGYAYLSMWRTRSAFRYTAETTVYLKQGFSDKGVGTILLSNLVEKACENNLHALVAFITLPNEPSIKLHEKIGFQKIAHYKEVGFKFHQWLDLGNWQLLLK